MGQVHGKGQRKGRPMTFQPSTKPIATITQNGTHHTHHYTLRMGKREMSGTNKARLAAYARRLGYKPIVIEDRCCNCGNTRCTCCNGGPL